MSKNIFKKIIILVVALGVLGTSQIGYAQIPIGEEIDLDLPREELLPNPTSQPNQQQPGQPQRNNKHLMDQLEGCGWGDLFSPNFACITKGIAWIAYTIFIFAAWLLAAVANVFNYVLGMTLDNANYSAVGAIKEGWAFSRDVVNLFFIFILLFIAIATILQIESYGAKKLLVWLVLVALLVNFSLIASQFIIYATNSLGILFYQSISANDSPFLSSLKIGKEGFRKDISGAFQKGLSDQTLANPPVTGFQVGPVASGDPKLSPAIINSTIIIILVAGTMLLTFAMIIFAAGAFFMVVRLAMLWLLMILAPFGFVLLILPITRSYALQWWRTLQSQALFAPAFMFFIIITIKIVQSDFVQDVSKKLTQQGISTTEFLFLLIINHIVILVLLGASLIVAKQMSMYGANAVMGTAKSFGKLVGGYMGRGGYAVGRGIRHAAAPLAERLATGEGAFAKTIRVIPGLRRAPAAVVAAERKQIEDIQKTYGDFTNKELKNMIPTARPLHRTAIVKELAKREDLKLEAGLNKDRMRDTLKHLDKNGMEGDIRDVLRLAPDLATELPGRTREQAVGYQKSEHIPKIIKELSKEPDTVLGMLKNYKPGHIQKLVERGDELFDGYMDELIKLAHGSKNAEDVARALESIGNRGTAKWIRSTSAIQLLGLETSSASSPGGATAGGTPPAGTPHSLGGPVIGFRGSTTTP